MNCYQLITFEKTVIFLVTLYLCVRVSVCVHSFYENVGSWRSLSWSDNKCLSFLVFSLSFELFFCLCLVDKFNIVFFSQFMQHNMFLKSYISILSLQMNEEA